MEKVKKIYFPVYDYTVLVIITNDIKQSRDKRIDDELEGEEECIAALHSYNDNESRAFLFFYPNPEISIIVHEVSHAVARMFQWVEAEPCHEILAYHLGYLTQQVYDFVKSKK